MSTGLLFERTEGWETYWRGLPEFVQEDLKPLCSLEVNLRSAEDAARFEQRFGRVYHDKWLWFPEKRYGNWRQFRWVTPGPVLPRYPVYVPTKGRHKTPYTIRTLEALGVPFRPVVEPQEAEAYAAVVRDPSSILVLPHRDRGLVVTRNWIWDHAAASGVRRFWTFDDNIQGLYRLNRNAKVQPTSGVFLRVLEDLVERFENVPIAGFQYEMFAMRRDRHPALALNTRVYSNMLIQTDYREPDGRPFRNEGFYNDDTDLCLRVLKRGDCTLLLYAFLVNKIATMTVQGGMTGHYQKDVGGTSGRKEDDGRWRMAEELRQKHPDVTTVVRKWGRWQHQVDYSPFAKNAPRYVPGLVVPEGVDEYGMELRRVGGAEEPEVPEPAPAPVGPPEPTRFTFRTDPVGPLPTVQVSLLDSAPERRPVPADWRPDEPPDLRAWGVREVALDLETTGLRWWAGDRPVGYSVSWEGEGGRVESRYLPFGHAGGNLDEGTVRRWALEQLRGLSVKNVSTKFDAHHSQEWGVDLDALGCRLGDVAHYAALLDDHRGEGWRREEKPFSLEALGLDYAGEGKVKDGLDKTRMASYHAHAVADYARQDSALVVKILRAQRPLLEAEGLEDVAALEDDVIPVVVEMERNAARIDVEKLRRWLAESEARLVALRVGLSSAVGWEVNPDSPGDVSRLFKQLGLRSGKYTETCPSCRAKTGGTPRCRSCGAEGRQSFAAGVLEDHADNPTVAKVVAVSRLLDLRSKFLVPYGEAVGDDGLLRFEFHQLKGDKYGTVSGRFSATKPEGARGGANPQQVFAVDNQVRMHCAACAAEWGSRKTSEQLAVHRAEHPEAFIVRELYVPDPGMVLAAPDADQIEYRVFAHLTNSRRLLEAYERDPRTDFHAWTYETIRKHRPDFERKRIKITNFMVLFGGGLTALSELLGVTEAEGRDVLSVYHRLFPEARDLMDRAMNTVRARGYVKTLAGRRARFPELRRIYAALNRAVSGGAADLNKMKLRSLYRRRKELGLKMRMTVHDEVVADVPAENVGRLAAAMDEQELPLRVPILWTTKAGRNWAEAK